MTRILGLSGSLRAGSYNRQLLEIAADRAPEGVQVDVHPLGEVPLFDEDLDGADVPAAAAALRDAVAAADAVLIATPENNRSLPAVLKNAIDWLSRPWQANALIDKPVAVIGTSLGPEGGARTHDLVRELAGAIGGAVVEQARLSVPRSLSRFADVDPRDDVEVADQVAQAVATLAAAVPVPERA